MARPLRIQYPGAWYHLTGRGNERRNIFRDDRDRLHFLELLEELVDRYRLRLYAYVLMDNHHHLLAQITEPNLSEAMQWLGESYATWFNVRHGRAGHLFQGRFQSILVDGEVYGVEVSRYLHLNPVRLKRFGLDKAAQQRSRAGVVDRPPDAQQIAERLQRLRQYRWNSYRSYVGLASVPGWLDVSTMLQTMGGRGLEEQRRAYRQYVEHEVREGWPESPWEKVVGGVVLGGPAFVRNVRRWLQGEVKEQPGLAALRERPSFEEVVTVVERLKGESWQAFRDRYGDWGRDLVLALARRHCGLKLRELAERTGGMGYRGVAAAVKRLDQRAKHDRQLRQALADLERWPGNRP